MGRAKIKRPPKKRRLTRAERNAIKGKFASIFEKEIFDDATSRGVVLQYESHSFEFRKSAPRRSVCGHCGSKEILVPGSYTPDFEVEGRFFVEAKGYINASKRSFLEAFVKTGPNIDLRFIFAQDNWLTKKKANRYSDWAEKIGCKYSIGRRIPEEWINE